MKTSRRLIHRDEFLPIYNKLPADKKSLIVGILGYKSCSQFVKTRHITPYYFNKLVEFKEHICKDKQSPNYVGSAAPFDLDQIKHYYKSLNDLIDSEDYINLSKNNRGKIIHEQNRISKIINK